MIIGKKEGPLTSVGHVTAAVRHDGTDGTMLQVDYLHDGAAMSVLFDDDDIAELLRGLNENLPAGRQLPIGDAISALQS